MANSDSKNNNIYNHKNIKDKLDLKNSKNIQRAKSSNDIKNINRKELSDKNIINLYNYSSITNNIKKINSNLKRDIKEINKKEIKAPNLRTLLFNNNEDKIYIKPINNIMYMTKISYCYDDNIINNYSPKSEKKCMPKKYHLNLENEEENGCHNDVRNNLIERNENGLLVLDNLIIEEIKEVKEDEEEDSQSLLDINKNSTVFDNVNNELIETIKEDEAESIISDTKKDNSLKTNKNNNKNTYNISSTSFQIKSCFHDREKMFIILLLQKQIKFSLKPYVFNLLKKYWRNKISL
jgi:hypothetical protein